MTRKINPAALDIIKRNEGCRFDAYLDMVGIPTIAYGHTGPDVKLGMHVNQAEADALLEKDLEKFQNGVSEQLAGYTATDNEYGAMVSLAFNIGLGNFTKSSVLRQHRLGHPVAAANAFLLWDRAGGREVKGLERRRQEERALYLTRE